MVSTFWTVYFEICSIHFFNPLMRQRNFHMSKMICEISSHMKQMKALLIFIVF